MYFTKVGYHYCTIFALALNRTSMQHDHINNLRQKIQKRRDFGKNYLIKKYIENYLIQNGVRMN